MKKTGILLIAIALLITLISGCSPTADNSSKAGKLKVYTSFYPMYDFAKKIGGDMVSITNLVPAGVEPHDWEPTASDIVNLENADMLIYNGLGMEHWVGKVLQTLSNKNLSVVKASDGIALIDSDTQGNNTDKHKEDEESGDPHVWLSIKNAKKQMENIKNAFAKADPSNAQYFEDSYIRYAKEFDLLDKEFSDCLSVMPNKNIVVAHQAFGYLCNDYGLRQLAIEGLSPDSEPEPGRMADIIKFVKEHNVKVIFFEELVSPKVAETIANATQAKTQVLNPLEGLSDNQLSTASDYLSVMRGNLAALKEALE